jgi:hypothetical protein
MTQGWFVDIAERDGVLVTAMIDKFGRGDVAWVSSDGVNWQRPTSGIGPTAQPRAVTASPDGFTIGGTVGSVGPPTLWTSTDALHWTEQGLGKTQGTVQALATTGHRQVAVVARAGNTEYWRESSSGQWTKARTEPSSTAQTWSARVLVTEHGFVSVDTRPWSWQSSPSGAEWRLVVGGTGPTGMVTTATTTNDGRVVAFVTADSSSSLRGAARPWLVDLTRR